jgi:hypothetical protein
VHLQPKGCTPTIHCVTNRSRIPYNRNNRHFRNLLATASLFSEQTAVTILANVTIGRFIPYRRGLSVWAARRLAERIEAWAVVVWDCDWTGSDFLSRVLDLTVGQRLGVLPHRFYRPRSVTSISANVVA